ncbi:MAG: zinc ribbon domain-containing protein [Clostridia bacterium]|nr:zinc ribbon domain-containing protein [Clostridia bacterium]
MFCTNCGKKVEDGELFCTGCGEKLETTAEQAEASTPVEEVQQNSVLTMTEEVQQPVPSFEEAPVAQQNFVQAFEVQEVVAPKKSYAGLIIGAVAAAVIVIFGMLFLFKDVVLATFMPKLYLGGAIDKTVEELSDESAELYKWLYGFDAEDVSEFTYKLGATVDEIAGQDVNSLGAEAVVAKSDNKKVLAANANLLYDGKNVIAANLSLDDEKIAFDIPELFDKSLSLPSKDFGKAWNSSDIGKESGTEFDDDLDLSYSKLFTEKKNDKVFTKETDKALKEISKTLAEEAVIENEKGTATVNGKSVKTRRLNVTIPANALEDYIVDTIKCIVKDENISANYPEDVKDQIDDMIDELSEGIEELSEVYDDVVIDLDVYNGKIVKITHEAEIEDADILVQLELRNSKNLIDDIYGLIEIKADGEKMTIELESKGNHVPNKNVYSDETYVKIKIPYEDSISVESSTLFDSGNNICNGEIKVKVEGEEAKVSFDGKYDNKDGFDVQLEDVSVKVGGETLFKGSINLYMNNKFEAEVPNIDGSLNILEADEDDMMNWADEVEGNFEEFAEKYQSEIEEIFGYDPFYDPYEDYYDDDYYFDDDYYYDDDYYDYY